MQTNINLTEYSIAEARYSEEFVKRGFVFNKSAKWGTVNASYEKFTKAILTDHPSLRVDIVSKNEKETAVLYSTINVQFSEEFMVLLDINAKEVTANLSGRDEEVITKHLAKLQKAFKMIPVPNDRVKIKFWYATNNGPAAVTRQIVVPDWKTISKNYAPATVENLEYLMKDFKPDGGGQLIIFHGPPGTGKSYSLRALLDSWKSWCVADYVLDPENLFSGSQGYMASLVLRGASDSYEFDPDEDEPRPKENDKWKLLILEDSGELLSADAKSRTGQGLSRLLNLVDGLIGQGLRVMVLITTNEDLEKLHPAVSREGRCAAAVKFRPFTYDQAIKWLEGNHHPTEIDISAKSLTLADLYSQIRKDEKNPRKKLIEMDLKQIGFKMR